jgi:predicted dehydrogenase
LVKTSTIYRAALIGCGPIGSGFADDPLLRGNVLTHAEAYTRCPATDLVAICDKDAIRLERCADRWSVAATYRDVSALLREVGPDIVSICTPDHTHFEVARAVLESEPRVRALICEKPLTVSLGEAEQIADLASSRGILLAVNYNRRYAANLRCLKSLLDGGDLGDVEGVSGWYTKGALHNGSHWFDLLNWLAGDVSWVMGYDRLREGGEDPTVDVALGLRSGAVAALHAIDSRKFTVFEMDLMTARGRARLVESALRLELFRAAPSTHYSGYVELRLEPLDLGEARDLMLHLVEDVVDALESSRPPVTGVSNAIAAMRVSLAALQSARTGQKVFLA